MGRIFRMGWFVDGGCCQNRDLGDGGIVAPGMLADLALFGEDIQDVAPSEIHTLRPAMTFLGGKVVTTR